MSQNDQPVWKRSGLGRAVYHIHRFSETSGPVWSHPITHNPPRPAAGQSKALNRIILLKPVGFAGSRSVFMTLLMQTPEKRTESPKPFVFINQLNKSAVTQTSLSFSFTRLLSQHSQWRDDWWDDNRSWSLSQWRSWGLFLDKAKKNITRLVE